MDALSTEWIVVLMNAIVIALVITLPLLVGIIIMRFYRRGNSQDRTAFD